MTDNILLGLGPPSGASGTATITGGNIDGAAIGANTPVTGVTTSGNITGNGGASSIILGNGTATAPGISLNSAASNGRYITFFTAGGYRWTGGVNNNPESGSNAGSNFVLNNYSDAGSPLGSPLFIYRATGQIYLGGTSLPVSFPGNISWGRNSGAADTAGSTGETIASTVTAAVAAATTTTGNVTSISLTAGKWLVSGLGIWTGGSTGLTSGSSVQMSITSTTAGTGTAGSTMTQESVLALLANGLFQLVLPTVIVNISTTTVYYLTGSCSYIAGTPTIAGNITAVRLA